MSAYPYEEDAMSIFVDPLRDHGWRLGPSCHMFASSAEELHAFAHRLGLRRAWFQDERVPHYDLTARKRALALQHGAIELPMRAAYRYWVARGWMPQLLAPIEGEELTQ